MSPDPLERLETFTTVLIFTLLLGIISPLIPILTHLKWSEEQQRFEVLTKKDPNKKS